MGGGISKNKEKEIKESNNNNNNNDKTKNVIDGKSELLNLLCENKHLKECNSNTKIFVGLTIFSAIQDYSTPRPKPSDCAIFSPHNPKRKTIDVLGIKIFEKDEDCQEYITKLIVRLRLDIVNALNQDPITDPLDKFDDLVDATNTTYDIFLTDGKLPLPMYPSSGRWENINSTKVFSQFAFGGLGQYYLNHISKLETNCTPPPESIYFIDVSHYSSFPVRNGFAKYGAIAFFDQNKLPCGIWHCETNQLILPIHPLYSQVAIIFRSSLRVYCTIQQHLFYVHWLLSNGVTVASEKYLSPNHPIRRLVRPHTIGSAAVNSASITGLAPYGGIISRIMAFTEESWSNVLQLAKLNLKYETLMKHFELSGLSEEMKETMPIYKDGFDYWNITEKYVRNYIELIYSDEISLQNDQEMNDFWNDIKSQNNFKEDKLLTRNELIEFLTNFIFTVTSLHELFGNLVEYPIFLFPGKVQIGSDQSDIQTLILETSLVSLTSAKMPLLIGNWWKGGIFNDMLFPSKVDYIEKLHKNHDDWQNELLNFSKEIERRNNYRDQPFNAMNPKMMESSVSV